MRSGLRLNQKQTYLPCQGLEAQFYSTIIPKSKRRFALRTLYFVSEN